MRNNDNNNTDMERLLFGIVCSVGIVPMCLVLGYLEIFHQLTSTLDVRERQPDIIFVLLYSS